MINKKTCPAYGATSYQGDERYNLNHLGKHMKNAAKRELFEREFSNSVDRWNTPHVDWIGKNQGKVERKEVTSINLK